HLLAVARVADPDPWRNRLREALESGDRKKFLQLVEVIPRERLPSSTQILVGGVLHSAGEWERSIAWLKEAQRQHPSDFWTNQELAHSLVTVHPPRWGEALRFYTAALAIRPQSAGAQNNVGGALRHVGA